MNADEIRAEATDRLARSLYGMQPTRAIPAPWEEQPDNIRRPHLRRASILVDALGDIVPTAVETEPRSMVVETFAGIAVGLRTTAPARFRLVGDWIEMPG